MKSRNTVLFAALLVLPVAAGGDRNQTASTPAPAPAFSQGMVLTIDPSSGKFVHGAQTTALQASLGEALSTSSEGLVEVKSPVAGGGVMVNLEGRFQNAMVIEMDANGNVSAPCVAGTPAETAKKEVE